MEINSVNSSGPSLEEMFKRMGELLCDIAASRTGFTDELSAIKEFHRPYEPGRGENLDLSA